MKIRLLFIVSMMVSAVSFAQIQYQPANLKGKIYKMSFTRPQHNKINKRSASNPTTCQQDTVSFTDLASTGYSQINVGNGQATGQFFGVANQEITVTGFRFFAYTPWDTNAQITSQDVWCKIYEANNDSLPTGRAIDSVKVTVDTVSGTLTFARLINDAVFTKPIKMTKPYVLTLECDATDNVPLTLCNSFANGDGEGRNLSTVLVNGRWYRSLALNVGGTTFDAHFQFLPFVKYNFGTDFTISDNCYVLTKQFTFDNETENNVSGSAFYNSYMYYASAGFDDLCHTWTYDNSVIDKEITDGKYQPSTKKNFDIKLTSYVVPYSLNVAFCYDSTIKTMYYKPSNPQVTSGTNGCMGDSLRLTVASSDFETKWFDDKQGSNPIKTGLSYTISKVTAIDTFYVRNINGSCNSFDIRLITTANQRPTSLTVTNDSVCSDASANLKASTDNGNILWYKSMTGGTSVFTGNVYSTSKLSADTTYYAEANNNGCALLSGRKAVTAFVNADFAPAKPTGAKDTALCYESGSVNVRLKAFSTSSASVRWFDIAAGGTPITTGTSLDVTVSSRGEQTFYVETWDGRCGSGRLPVKVVAGQVPSTFARVSDEICKEDSADIAAAASWGGVNWYLTKSDKTPFSSNKFVRVGGLSEAKFYVYFKTVDGICENSNFDSVEVTVNIPPTAKVLSQTEICKGGKAMFELEIPEGIIHWFDSETGTTPVSTGTTYNLGEVFSNTTMWYEVELNGCTSERTALTMNSLDKPVAGFETNLEFPKKITCTPFSSNNMDILWDFGDGNTSTDAIGINTYENEGTYTIKMLATSTLSGCKDSITSKVVVEHNNIETNNPTMVVYPNPVRQGDFIYIKNMRQPSTVSWTDLMGRTIETEEVQNNKAIKTPFENGLYLLKIQSGLRETVIKVRVFN